MDSLFAFASDSGSAASTSKPNSKLPFNTAYKSGINLNMNNNSNLASTSSSTQKNPANALINPVAVDVWDFDQLTNASHSQATNEGKDDLFDVFGMDSGHSSGQMESNIENHQQQQAQQYQNQPYQQTQNDQHDQHHKHYKHQQNQQQQQKEHQQREHRQQQQEQQQSKPSQIAASQLIDIRDTLEQHTRTAVKTATALWASFTTPISTSALSSASTSNTGLSPEKKRPKWMKSDEDVPQISPMEPRSGMDFDSGMNKQSETPARESESPSQELEQPPPPLLFDLLGEDDQHSLISPSQPPPQRSQDSPDFAQFDIFKPYNPATSLSISSPTVLSFSNTTPSTQPLNTTSVIPQVHDKHAYDTALSALRIGDAPLALQHLNHIEQSDVMSLLLRAQAHKSLGDYPAVCTDIDAAMMHLRVGNDPQYCEALVLRANAFEGRERYVNARRDWEALFAVVESEGKSAKMALQGIQRCKAVLQPSAAKPSSAIQAAPFRPRAIISDRTVKKPIVLNPPENNLDIQLTESINARISSWSHGKEQNLRALMTSLHTILPSTIEFKKIQVSEVLTDTQVKKAYFRAVSKCHPDKLPLNINMEDKLVATSAFEALSMAWAAVRV